MFKSQEMNISIKQWLIVNLRFSTITNFISSIYVQSFATFYRILASKMMTWRPESEYALSFCLYSSLSFPRLVVLIITSEQWRNHGGL